MRTIDFSPLYRSSIGFDRVMNALETATRVDAAPGYPPYNIEKLGEDAYRIVIAVAGFAREDLEIESHQNTLTVTGKQDSSGNADGKYLYQGIAERAFKRSFDLADHVKVVNASLDNGLLNIELVREVPEALKPRRIEIVGEDEKLVEGKAEAA